jgi:hypothetical protein
MKYTVTIPETLVTLETSTGTLPEGTMVQLSVPVKGLKTVPVSEPTPVPEKPAEPIPAPTPTSAQPDTPQEVEVPELPTRSITPNFDRSYDPVEFRKTDKRFDVLGKAPDLGISDSNWTIVINVRFTDFSRHQRVIGSATASSAGSSIQIGVLKGGILWVDTFQGAMTAGQLEVNKWYEIAITHNRVGQESIYIDKKLIALTSVPVFKSQDDVYVGRWLNDYFDFDLKRVRIYHLLSTEEIELI